MKLKRLFSALCALVLLACILCVPAAAEEKETFVYDLAGVLSDEEASDLNNLARTVSLHHLCGVYIAVFPDMGEYGYRNIEDFAEAVYKQWEFGIGEDLTGIVLVMSMSERDYDLCAYGDGAHYAFTDYGKEVLADKFKDNFRQNDWAGGFADYIEQCDYMLSRAEDGNPIDISGGSSRSSRNMSDRITKSILPGLVVGIIVAFIYCGSLKNKMKSAKIAREASAYIAPRGIWMQAQEDVFTHTTQTRQHIDRDRGSHGGTSVNSGGFSHSSGKF